MPGTEQVISCDDLADAGLLLEALYDGGTRGTIADDPLARLVPVGKQGSFRYAGVAPRTKL